MGLIESPSAANCATVGRIVYGVHLMTLKFVFQYPETNGPEGDMLDSGHSTRWHVQPKKPASTASR